jgi:2-oxoglutarate ferredoxin oxidoreductase subunit alpha
MTNVVEDTSVVVAGQGGDGSVTLVSLLAQLAAGHGYHVYEAREVGSRVKGGPAAAELRISVRQRQCLADATDVLVAFDADAVEQNADRLTNSAFVIYDTSDGVIGHDLVPPGATVVGAPFARIAARDLRRDLYKNSIAFALATRLFAVPEALAEETLLSGLRKLPETIRNANVDALRQGFAYADGAGLVADTAPWSLRTRTTGPRLRITGNEAIALGFTVAGGRFFAGYPITPASEILEWLGEHLPPLGGVVVQAEDELSAINMALGAALTGARAMTASSGPGIALMQESVGHLSSAEVGLVIVDCQRAGPSTGMPTKPEQSDINMLVYGGNGDVGRVVLAPSDPREAFELTVAAMNIADRYQGPVYVAIDQAIAQNASTIDRFALDAVSIDRGKLLGQNDMVARSEFRRYTLEPGDGISPRVAFGTRGGRHLVTGNEHDEWGLVATQPRTRTRMMRKRASKIETILADLPRAVVGGDANAPIALIGFGMAAGPMAQAADALAERDLPVRVIHPRTLWPILEDVRDVVSTCCTYVIEHNGDGQYGEMLAAIARQRGHVHKVLRYDGHPFRPHDIVAAIEEHQYS